jgi:Flp pilus assembly protein TadD
VIVQSSAKMVGSLLFVGLLAAASGCASLSNRGGEDATVAARKRLVRELVARGEWNQAFAHADDLHRERPADAEVLTLRGTIFRERKLVDDAEADLRAAVEADGAYAPAHAALGILLDSLGRGSEAERHHRKAVALDGKNGGKNAAYLNNLGFSLLVRRQTREALEVLQRSARIDPTNLRLRTNLGFAYASAGDLPRAAREFDLGAAPAESRNNLGFAYESRGDLANAFQLYAEAVRLDPACTRARGNLAHVAGKLGRPLPPELTAPPADSTPASEEQTR